MHRRHRQRILGLLTALAMMLGLAPAVSNAAIQTSTVEPTELTGYPAAVPFNGPESVTQWQQLQFGLFLHWGVYSMFAGSYEGKVQTKGYPEQIKAWMDISDEAYLAEAAKMDAPEWDADAVCQLAKDSGMQYVKITTKHHDGFAMWDTETTDYNVVDATPFGQDPIRQLADACGERGIKLAYYFSIIDWTVQDPEPYANKNPIPESMMPLILAQIDELMTNYGPISEFWFDMGAPTKEQSERMVARVKQHQPDTVTNSRVWNDAGDFEVGGDNAVPKDFRVGPWESILSVFPQCWSYCDTFKANRSDSNLLPKIREAVSGLVTVASGGGQFAYNLGPKGDGSIDPFDLAVVEGIGGWMQRHPDAITDARPTWFPIPNWGRVTTKGDTLHLMVQPNMWHDGATISLPGVANAVTAVTIDGTDTALDHRREGSDLIITLAGDSPDEVMPVIRVELDGEARILPAQTVQLHEGAGIVEASEVISRTSAKGKGAVALDAFVVDQADVDDAVVSIEASGVRDETYRLWVGETSVEVTGEELLAGPVGEGFALSAGEVQRIRLEYAAPDYYADALEVTIERIVVQPADSVGQGVAPRITTQPVDAIAYAGDTVTFSAAANGSPEPTWQWYRLDGPEDTEGTPIDGATSATLTVTVTVQDAGARFVARASNEAGTATSKAVTVTVRDSSENLALGRPATQSTTFDYGEPAAANRANDGDRNGVFYDGSVSSTDTFDSDPWWQVDLEDVYALTTVNVWNRDPSDNCYDMPCSDVLTDAWVLASAEPFASRWSLDDALADPGVKAIQIQGVAGRPTSVGLDGFEARYVRVVLPVNFQQLALAEVEVFGEPVVKAVAPTIGDIDISGDPAEDVTPVTSDRPTVQVTKGALLTLSVDADGVPEPEVRWQRNDGDWTETGAQWHDIEGAVGSEYSIAAGPEHHNLVVRAVATNEAGEAVTTSLTIVVVEAPTFTTQPAPVTAQIGEEIVLGAEATGMPEPLIEWMRATDDGWEPVGTGEQLTLEATAALDGAVFKAVATNQVGSVESTPVTVTVTEPGEEPSVDPSEEPSVDPSEEPSASPSEDPTAGPSVEPSAEPTQEPTVRPTQEPTVRPTQEPTVQPSEAPVRPGLPSTGDRAPAAGTCASGGTLVVLGEGRRR